MWSTAVTRIGDQNFEMLSCENIVPFEEGDDALKKIVIQKLIKPFTLQHDDESFIQNIELKVKKFLLNSLKQPDGIRHLDFKDGNNEEYKILFHKMKTVKFGFLVRLLSDADMCAIEQKTESKTYLTGEKSDMLKTKKDFH